MPACIKAVKDCFWSELFRVEAGVRRRAFADPAKAHSKDYSDRLPISVGKISIFAGASE